MVDFFRGIPGVAAALSFVVLSLAVVHEWAFYLVIGDRYQTLMGVTDYFNSAVSWLPWAAVGLFGSAIWHLTDDMRNIPDGLKREFYKKHRLIWVYHNGPEWMFRLTWWMLVVVGTAQFLFGDWYTNFALVIVVGWLWLRIFEGMTKHDDVKSSLSSGGLLVLAFAPVLLLVAFVGGSIEGAASLHRKEPVYTAKLKDQSEEHEWYVIRNLASGIIFRDLRADDKVQYVKWAEVVILKSKISEPNRTGFVCRMTGYACFLGPNTSDKPQKRTNSTN